MPGIVIIEGERHDTFLEKLLRDPAEYRRRAYDDARRDVLQPALAPETVTTWTEYNTAHGIPAPRQG
jgi:hypothetical protein